MAHTDPPPYRTVMTPALREFLNGDYQPRSPDGPYEFGEAILEDHCQQCGSTEPEDIDTGTDPDYQGYTRCCNERVMTDPCNDTDCAHS